MVDDLEFSKKMSMSKNSLVSSLDIGKNSKETMADEISTR
jgi:hypothetical protein